MAAEIVELDISDDETEVAKRPIGWNYQGIDNSGKGRFKGYTCKIPKTHRKSSEGDEILIASPTKEELPAVPTSKSHKPVPKVKYGKGSSSQRSDNSTSKRNLPHSSTRQEIKAIIRGTSQSSMNKFLKSTPPTQSQSSSNTNIIDGPKDNGNTKDDIEELSPNNEHKRACIPPSVAPDKTQTEDASSADELTSKSRAVLTSFISKWKEIKGCGDKSDEKIEDKIWKYYHLAHSTYTHSRKFLGSVESFIKRMTEDNTYVLIKDLLDSLKYYKNVPYIEKKKSSSEGGEAKTEAKEGGNTEEPPLTEEEKKREKKLRKIEKMMKKISEKIQELDEEEVDLDDDDNSAYLVQERLKVQFMKLDDFYCKLAKCSRATGRPVERRFRYSGSRYSEINQRITAWINKHREFPDYQDVLNLVKKVTNDSLLPLRPETVRVQAQEIFRDVGRMLKERRESDDMFSIYAYSSSDAPDPASDDKELANILDNNAKEAQEKLVKVFQEYVDKEMEMKETSDKIKAKTQSTDDDTVTSTKESTAADDDDETSRDTSDTARDADELPPDTPTDDNDERKDMKDKHDGGGENDKGRGERGNEGAEQDDSLPPIEQLEVVFDRGGDLAVVNSKNDDEEMMSDSDPHELESDVELHHDENSSGANSLPDVNIDYKDMNKFSLEDDNDDDELQMDDHLKELMTLPTEEEDEEVDSEQEEVDSEQEEKEVEDAVNEFDAKELSQNSPSAIVSDVSRSISDGDKTSERSPKDLFKRVNTSSKTPNKSSTVNGEVDTIASSSRGKLSISKHKSYSSSSSNGVLNDSYESPKKTPLKSLDDKDDTEIQCISRSNSISDDECSSASNGISSKSKVTGIVRITPFKIEKNVNGNKESQRATYMNGKNCNFVTELDEDEDCIEEDVILAASPEPSNCSVDSSSTFIEEGLLGSEKRKRKFSSQINEDSRVSKKNRLLNRSESPEVVELE